MKTIKYNALVMHEDDNVATAVDDMLSGDRAHIRYHDNDQSIRLVNDIKFGHKFALADINKDGEIMKYGETIGVSNRDIKKGEHVHIHNIDSVRGKGAVTKHAF